MISWNATGVFRSLLIDIQSHLWWDAEVRKQYLWHLWKPLQSWTHILHSSNLDIDILVTPLFFNNYPLRQPPALRKIAVLKDLKGKGDNKSRFSLSPRSSYFLVAGRPPTACHVGMAEGLDFDVPSSKLWAVGSNDGFLKRNFEKAVLIHVFLVQ